MVKGIKIATTDISKASKDEKVVDSTLPGSWKVAKKVTIEIPLTYSSGSAVSAVVSKPHGLGFTPAYIAGVFIPSENAFYNIPTFQGTFASLKVYVDATNVYASAVSVYVGTNIYKFNILLLGEKIE